MRLVQALRHEDDDGPLGASRSAPLPAAVRRALSQAAWRSPGADVGGVGAVVVQM
jgi:hypothetical protein